MYNNNTNKIDPKKGMSTTNPKKETAKVIEPHKDETKLDPKKNAKIKH